MARASPLRPRRCAFHSCRTSRSGAMRTHWPTFRARGCPSRPISSGTKGSSTRASNIRSSRPRRTSRSERTWHPSSGGGSSYSCSSSLQAASSGLTSSRAGPEPCRSIRAGTRPPGFSSRAALSTRSPSIAWLSSSASSRRSDGSGACSPWSWCWLACRRRR